jgi:hypothetical protein
MMAQRSRRTSECERGEIHTGSDAFERGDVFQTRLERASGIPEHDDLVTTSLKTSREDFGDDVKTAPFRTGVA